MVEIWLCVLVSVCLSVCLSVCHTFGQHWDVTDRRVIARCSFDEVMRLCFLVQHLSGGRGQREPRPPVAVVANKKDLQYDRMVSHEEGRSLAAALNTPFWEISARDGPDETTQVARNIL